MTQGRKPKPTWLKIVSGKPGHRALNENEPALARDLAGMQPPAWFSPEQSAEWFRVLEDIPYLKSADRAMLVPYCVAVVAHAEAAQKVALYGAMIKSPVTGVPMQSPYMAIMNKQAAIARSFGSEMGLSPASRSRVSVKDAKPPQGSNPFQDLKELGD